VLFKDDLERSASGKADYESIREFAIDALDRADQ